MTQLLINYGSAAAFAILSLGIFLQIKKLLILKNAQSIAIWEIILRFVAGFLLLVKFCAINDGYLRIGQGIFVALYFVILSLYFVILSLFLDTNTAIATVDIRIWLVRSICGRASFFLKS